MNELELAVSVQFERVLHLRSGLISEGDLVTLEDVLKRHVLRVAVLTFRLRQPDSLDVCLIGSPRRVSGTAAQ